MFGVSTTTDCLPCIGVHYDAYIAPQWPREIKGPLEGSGGACNPVQKPYVLIQMLTYDEAHSHNIV